MREVSPVAARPRRAQGVPDAGAQQAVGSARGLRPAAPGHRTPRSPPPAPTFLVRRSSSSSSGEHPPAGAAGALRAGRNPPAQPPSGRCRAQLDEPRPPLPLRTTSAAPLTASLLWFPLAPLPRNALPPRDLAARVSPARRLLCNEQLAQRASPAAAIAPSRPTPPAPTRPVSDCALLPRSRCADG